MVTELGENEDVDGAHGASVRAGIRSSLIPKSPRLSRRAGCGIRSPEVLEVLFLRTNQM